MRFLILAVAVGCGVSAVCGQVIDRVFWLPDSAPRIEWVTAAAASPVSGRVYFSEIEAWLHVFDPAALRKHGFEQSIDMFSDVEPCPGAHRVCALDWTEGGRLVGFDDAADTVVYRRQGFGDSPYVLQYNPALNRLYVGDFRVVEVFEPETGILLDTIAVSGYVRRLALDTRRNYLFCAFWRGGSVAYIDCQTGVVAGSISGTEFTSDMAVHPTEPKLYCLVGEDDPGPQVLKTVDLDSLAVVESIPIPISESWEEYGRLFVNRPLNRLYCLGMWDGLDRSRDRWTWDSIAVFDLSADTLVKMLGLPDQEEDVRGAVVNQTTGRFYLACPFNDRVLVVGPGDSISASIPVRWWPTGVAWDSVHNRLCVAAECRVLVVDGSADTVIHVEDYCGTPPSLMHWNEAAERLYIFSSGGIGRVGPGDTLERWTAFRCLTCWFAPYSRELNRHYVLGDTGDGQHVFVYDCATDSVRSGFRHYGSTVFALVPETRLLYAQSETTRIYDILRDSVVATRTGFPRAIQYDPHTATSYGCYQNGVAVLNPRGDSVVLWVLIPHILETELVADTAAGQLWLVTGYGEQLLVFDCSLLRVIDSVRVSPHSHAPVWIDGERKIYAFGSESLLVVSAEQRQVIKRIPLDYTPGGFKAAYDSERNRLYVYRRGEVMAFDCRRDSLCWTLPGQTFTCIALNAPGRELFGAYGKKVTVIRDTTASGVGEGMAVRGAQLRPPTVVRSVLPVHGTQAAILVNAAGRRVMELVPGANDVRHLSPGVYFVCSQPSAVGRQPSAVQKVVVTK